MLGERSQQAHQAEVLAAGVVAGPVAGCEVGDPGADLLEDPRALVAADHGQRRRAASSPHRRTVRRDLADPALARYGIAALAARSCVTNQSWLSRAFRNRFGTSPSEYRQAELELLQMCTVGHGTGRDPRDEHHQTRESG